MEYGICVCDSDYSGQLCTNQKSLKPEEKGDTGGTVVLTITDSGADGKEKYPKVIREALAEQT